MHAIRVERHPTPMVLELVLKATPQPTAVVLTEPTQERWVTLERRIPVFWSWAVVRHVVVGHSQSLQKSAMTDDRRLLQAHT